MAILEPPHRELVVYDEDPEKLVGKVIDMLDEKYQDIHEQLTKRDEHWFLRLDDLPPHAG
jgi:hypothetical protein